MSKKGSLPVYTTKTFERKPESLHFEMSTLEQDLSTYFYTSPPHRHDCFFLMFVTQGSGTHTIDTETYPVRPFSLYFMLPGQIHSWSFSKDVKGFYIYFTLEFYKLYVRERHLEKFPYLRMYTLDAYVQFDSNQHAVIRAIFENMHLEFTQRQVGWDDVLRNALDIVLIHMTRCNSQNQKITGTLKTVTNIRTLQALIERHFIQYKLPSDYAHKINVTPKHLNAQCKMALNKTVTDLIHERILLEAKRYLVYTDHSMKQIAGALGFNDLSYFMRFFKKLTTQTPDQFRKSSEIFQPVHTKSVFPNTGTATPSQSSEMN